MKNTKVLKVGGLLASMLLLCSAPARSDVLYDFSFTPGTGPVTQGFNVTLRYADFVTETGMKQLPLAVTSTVQSLGYSVKYAGMNSIGWWGMDSTGAAEMDEGGFSNGAPTYQSFLYIPNVRTTAYYTTPGTFDGTISGNAPIHFQGVATLKVSVVDALVPEPGSLALMALACMAGLGVSRFRKV